MATLVMATRHALLVAREGSRWSVEEHLHGRSPDCIAIDPQDPDFIYCGTSGSGLWRTRDGGRTWNSAGDGIGHETITAVAVHAHEDGRGAVVYAGTEPSALFRSGDGGETWTELSGLRALPSAPAWSFPPRPETHHVRWIEADVCVRGRLFVAIEAGALVRSLDGGRTWHDRVDGGPYDTHTAATHPLAPGRIYSAAGDGYFESADAGETWTSPEEGLRHLYLVGVAVDPADPDAVVVSAAAGPRSAYGPRAADAYVYRQAAGASWRLAMDGLPDARGTTISRFASSGDPGVLYAANNRGLFRSADAGATWKGVDVTWPEPGLRDGVEAIACFKA